MGASAFQAGAQVSFDGTTYCLLRKVTADIWQLEDARTKRIHEYSDTALRSLYADGRLIFAKQNAASVLAKADEEAGMPHQDITPDQWEAAKLKRLYVLAILELPNTRSRITAAISDLWQRIKRPENPPGYVSVYRWKQRYLDSGKDITSLVPNYAGRGNRNSRYPAEVIQFVEQAITTIYLTQERRTIQDTLDDAIGRINRENKKRPATLSLQRPTYRLVKRLIEAIPAFDLYAARHGRTAAAKRFRSVQAHRTTAAPLERAEIDHTLLDLMVIDEQAGLPLGRPWVTACIDDYSRNILGIHISFEPPSHLTVARCLKHAFLPKTNLSKAYPAIENAWEAHGVMRELVVDNGPEFHSVSLENACYSLGIELHFSARKTPWFKGKIERFLGTLNHAVAHTSPGTTFRNVFDKEEYDPSKHAVVRYGILKEIVYRWIADVYHQKPHRTLAAPPAAIWRQSITPEEILLPDDPARLDAILGRSEERRLTHKGIQLDGLLYNSPELDALRDKHGATLDVEIRVDNADLGQIVVLSPDKRRMFKASALRSDYATGLSEWQHRICKRFAARHWKQDTPDAWYEAKLQIAELIDAEFMHKKQKTRTKIARYKGDAKLTAPEHAAPPEITVAANGPTNSSPTPEITPITASDQPQTKPEPARSLETPVRRFKPVLRERRRQFMDMDQGEEAAHG